MRQGSAHLDVILTRDVTERGLRVGDVGTVVERCVVPGGTADNWTERSQRAHDADLSHGAALFSFKAIG